MQFQAWQVGKSHQHEVSHFFRQLCPLYRKQNRSQSHSHHCHHYYWVLLLSLPGCVAMFMHLFMYIVMASWSWLCSSSRLVTHRHTLFINRDEILRQSVFRCQDTSWTGHFFRSTCFISTHPFCERNWTTISHVLIFNTTSRIVLSVWGTHTRLRLNKANCDIGRALGLSGMSERMKFSSCRELNVTIIVIQKWYRHKISSEKLGDITDCILNLNRN